MTRLFDIIFSSVGLVLLLPIMILIVVLCWIETGAPLFKQERVGRYQKPFILLKFRTMKVGTPSEATHLISSASVTNVGFFLRRSKLDELPQLWNVIKGDMSLVGPRPCLFNQLELLRERESRGIFNFRPGITGYAQLQGIDMSRPSLLARTEEKMMSDMDTLCYLTYVFRTALGSRCCD